MSPQESDPPPPLRSLAETLDANQRYNAYIQTLLHPLAPVEPRQPVVDAPQPLEALLEVIEKENDPERALDAFERVKELLTDRKDWKALERAHRRMLQRFSTNEANARATRDLWYQLGLVYRDRLGELQAAIEAFTMATRYEAEANIERRILAELHRSLYRLALEANDHDRAWCLCSALAFVREANEEERSFFEEHRTRAMIEVKSRLDDEQWVKHVLHPDEDIFIGKIFQMVTPAAIVARTSALKKAKQLPALDRRFKQDPATSTVTFAKIFGWAAQVLGIQSPELYVRNDVAGGIIAVPSRPPASVAGQTLLTGFTPQELAFIVGRHLSSYRGEHYIKSLFPTLGELRIVFFSALKLVEPDFAIPAEMVQSVSIAANELAKYMQPIERDALRLVVTKFIEDGAKANLTRWMEAVDITAARVGLLLCADLEIAKKLSAGESAATMSELLAFSVSEQYLALRKALGIGIR